MEPLVLDTKMLEPWEIAARLDTLLAYPHVSAKRSTDVVTVLCADQIRTTIEADPSKRKALIERYPRYNPSRVRTSTIRIAEKRRNAQLAGAVFLGMIHETATGSPLTYKGKPIKPTLDFLVDHYWRSGFQSDDPDDHYSAWIHSIEEREVRRRFPVAHLCAALQSLTQQRYMEGRSNVYDYQDLQLLREWVMRAEVFAGLLRRAENCKSIADVLISVRWIE